MARNLQANQGLQQQVNDHLNQHNANVRNINSQNQQIQQNIDAANAQNAQLGQDISSAKGVVSAQDINRAGMAEINRNNAATYAIRHEAEFVRTHTPGIGFNHGGSDDAIHAAQAGMTQARQTAENGGFGAIQQEVNNSISRMSDAAKDVLPDVQGFTSVAGKAGFVNSEYISNLQAIVNGSPDTLTYLSKLFSATQGLGDPAQVVGTIGSVPEIPALVLETGSASFTNALPFIAAIGNATHLEAQRSKMNLDRQRQEEKERQSQKQAKKDAKETSKGANTEEKGR